jgi:hypothetical protein
VSRSISISARDVSLALVRFDRDYLYRVGSAATRRPTTESSLPLLCTFEHMALIDYEVRRYLGAEAPELLAHLPPREPEVVERSRHAAKRFLDTSRYVEGVAAHCDAITQRHRWAFLENVPFGTGRLLRPFRNDLGLFRHRGVLVGTTHSVHFNLGLPAEAFDFNDLDRSIGVHIREAAQQFGELAQPDPGAGATNLAWLDVIDPADVSCEDVKAASFYRSAFAGSLPTGMAAAVLSLQAACGAAQGLLGLSPCPTAGVWTEPILKLRFVVLFQALESLRRLVERHSGVIGPEACAHLSQFLNEPEARQIQAGGGRRLRNILVHYGLHDVDDSDLRGDRQLFGLVELCSGGLTYQQLCVLTDRLLAQLRQTLCGWSGVA